MTRYEDQQQIDREIERVKEAMRKSHSKTLQKDYEKHLQRLNVHKKSMAFAEKSVRQHGKK